MDRGTWRTTVCGVTKRQHSGTTKQNTAHLYETANTLTYSVLRTKTRSKSKTYIVNGTGRGISWWEKEGILKN